MKYTIALICSFLLTHPIYAQDSLATQSPDLLDLSLEQLMNIPVTVASQKSTSLGQTPGSITVFTEDMIQKSGARDINDLLMRVPGFDIANDVGNVLSFGIRGNWGIEGKILVMVDGQIINETSYGSAPLAQRFPLNHIKQIEIIRGSGSVVYGGVAALAVISIKTKTGSDLKGIAFTSSAGNSNQALSGTTQELSLGNQYANGLNVALHLGYHEGNASNRVYNSPSGEQLNYKHESSIRSRYANLNLNYKNLDVHLISEDLRLRRTNDPDGRYTYFSGTYLGSSYTFTHNKLRIIPSISLKRHQPWNVQGGSWDPYKVLSSRMQGSVKAFYEASKKLDLMAGTEYFSIDSWYPAADPAVVFYNGRKSMQLSNYAFFSEAVFHTNQTSVHAGIRFDQHSTAGSAFVPRLAITQSVGNLNIKATYSQAFKTPLIYNVNLTRTIKPERVRMVELEAAYKFTANILLTVNLYDVKIKESIVYQYDAATSVESYANEGTTGTRGIETELRTTGKWGFVTLNHSFYRPAYRGVTSFLVPDSKNAFMGLPAQKITLTSGVQITSKLSVNPSVMVIGKRTSVVHDVIQDIDVTHTEKTFVGFNTSVVWKEVAKGLSLTLSAYDIFNQQLTYLPAYVNGIHPQPAMAREFMLKVSYALTSR